jgi:single-strand DNA-binding protein
MLNVAALNGRLTADPELRHTSGDIPVTSFTLAVDRGYVRAGSERQADFIDIVCWRSTAEFVSKYFHKGQLVAVEGSIQTRSYTDNQGVRRKATEIVANRVDFAESKRDGSFAGASFASAPTEHAAAR